MNDLIHTNLLGDSHTAFIRQVTNYLDTLERGIALTMQRNPKLGAHEIQAELKKSSKTLHAPPTQVSSIGLPGMFGP